LTEEEKTKAAQQFLDILETKGVCNVEATCQLSDVEVSCGFESDDASFFGYWDLQSGSRKKRSTVVPQLKFSLKVSAPAKPQISADCSSFCGSNDNSVVTEDCLEACGLQFDRERSQSVTEAAGKIEELFNTLETKDELQLIVSNQTFAPLRGVHAQPITASCGKGMMLSNLTGSCGW
jgi:hypothetical protein